jgi:hypothetical protein
VLIVVCQLSGGPDAGHGAEVIARGFAPEGEGADTLLTEVRERAGTVLDSLDLRETKLVQSHLHDELAELIHRRSGSVR